MIKVGMTVVDYVDKQIWNFLQSNIYVKIKKVRKSV